MTAWRDLGVDALVRDVKTPGGLTISRDGRRLAYFPNRKLTVSGPDGSARQIIGDLRNPRSAPPPHHLSRGRWPTM